MKDAAALVSPELLGFALTLALSLLIGFEREELRDGSDPGFFGGVRTFPLIGLTGHLLWLAFPGSAVPYAVGLLALGGLLVVSHHASIGARRTGITTEMAALLTYAIGAAAAARQYWVAVAAGVVAVLLLQEKRRLEWLATHVPRREVGTLVRFLLLTGVILPVVPNRPFGRFEINPFTIWLVVVAVSGLSYLSYLLRLWIGGRRTALMTGVLGGAYSSTATTVVLARASRTGALGARAAAGGIVAATGVMYIRLWVLVLLFAPVLAAHLTLPFWTTAAACLLGAAVLVRSAREPAVAGEEERITNPLEITSALTFGALFLLLLVVTRVVAERFGGTGLLVLAVVTGAADVDPFILGLTQYAGHGLPPETAALAVVVAAASNNLMKAAYARIFGSPRAGWLGAAGLGLAAALATAVFLLG